jgi:hypothetical protein
MKAFKFQNIAQRRLQTKIALCYVALYIRAGDPQMPGRKDKYVKKIDLPYILGTLDTKVAVH